MKKKTMMKAAGFLAAVALLASAMPATDPISKESGATVVNTTTLAKEVRGFRGATPVKIYIKKGKVVKVEALKTRKRPSISPVPRPYWPNMRARQQTRPPR